MAVLPNYPIGSLRVFVGYWYVDLRFTGLADIHTAEEVLRALDMYRGSAHVDTPSGILCWVLDEDNVPCWSEVPQDEDEDDEPVTYTDNVIQLRRGNEHLSD